MKFGTIGTSWITASFVDAALTVSRIEYCGAYSRTLGKAEEFASKFGCACFYDDLGEMLRSEIDAVYIASPNSFHYEQSKKCLEAGKHVICEKPLCVNPSEIEELQDLAASNNLVYMEAIMFLHIKELEILKNAMNGIGRITSAHLDFSQLSSKYRFLSDDFTPNIFNPEFATGCLMDIGVYNVYTAIELFGYPKKITSSCHFMDTGADSHGTAIFDYPDKQVTLNFSKVGQSRGYSQIFGDKGTILLPSVSQLHDMKVVFWDGREKILSGKEDRRYVMSGEASDFKDFIENREENEEKYRHSREMSVSVSKAMYEIRKQNPGFLF